MSNVFTQCMATMTLITGSGRALKLPTKPSSLAISGITADFRETVQIMDCNTTRGLGYGPDVVPQLTFTTLDEFPSQLKDFLLRKGVCASDATKDPEGVVWTLELLVEWTHPSGLKRYGRAPNARPTFGENNANEGGTCDVTFDLFRGSADDSSPDYDPWDSDWTP